MYALLLAAASLFLNVVPDLPDGVDGVVRTAVEWSGRHPGGVSLYTFHLPPGWSQRDINANRPLARFARFARALKDAGGEAGILVYAPPEREQPKADADFLRRLGIMGSALTDLPVRFVLVDGLFRGLSAVDARVAAAAFRKGLDDSGGNVTVALAMTSEVNTGFAALAKALAGTNSVPVVRLDNAVCLERTVKDLPYVAMATMAKVAFPREPMLFYDDADTSPHNLWSRSATTLVGKLAVSLFAGAQGAVTWYVGQQSADGYPTNPRFAETLSRYEPCFRELRTVLEGSRYAGIAIPLSRRDQGLECANWGELVFGSFGIPFYATYDLDTPDVCALMGSDSVSLFTIAELERLFRGRILVDGDAARALSERGLSRLLGVHAERAPLEYNCERLVDGTFVRLSRSASVPRLTPLARENVEVLSELVHRIGVTPRHNVLTPACVVATNELGGVVVTTVYNCRLEPWNLRNEARRDLIVSMLERLHGGPLPVRCSVDQDVLTLTRRKDGKTYVLTVNLGYDPVVPVLERTEAPMPLEVLGEDGTWKACASQELPCAGFAVWRY